MLFFLEQHSGDWTVPPLSGKKPTELGEMDLASISVWLFTWGCRQNPVSETLFKENKKMGNA
jgi:hypothetical protein